ncbi:uncharacterized protein LOC141916861 [Strix aluco]|uniref:uncharacterized protein LOC141916861 n=1 Tax=Strix aluco TaxID=111821 RepID=UPI003DA495D6
MGTVAETGTSRCGTLPPSFGMKNNLKSQKERNIASGIGAAEAQKPDLWRPNLPASSRTGTRCGFLTAIPSSRKHVKINIKITNTHAQNTRNCLAAAAFKRSFTCLLLNFVPGAGQANAPVMIHQEHEPVVSGIQPTSPQGWGGENPSRVIPGEASRCPQSPKYGKGFGGAARAMPTLTPATPKRSPQGSSVLASLPGRSVRVKELREGIVCVVCVPPPNFSHPISFSKLGSSLGNLQNLPGPFKGQMDEAGNVLLYDTFSSLHNNIFKTQRTPQRTWRVGLAKR